MSRLSACVATALLLAAARGQIFPPPPEPAGNPTTPQKALLGKALFWDEQLSTTRTMACGTCHVFARGGSDPRGAGIHPGADGLFGTPDDVRGSFGVVLQDLGARYLGSPWFGIRRQVTSRKAQSPINAAYENELFWDGRAGGTFVDPVSGQVLLASGGALETQAAAPPISEVEMSHAGHDWTHAASDLAYCTPLALATNVPAPLQAFVAGQTYAQLFAQVFGSPGVTPARILFAIAAYERTLVSDQSPYDRSLAGLHTLTLAEQQGQQVFTALCATCHVDVTVAVLARGPGVNDYRNIGVRPIAEDEGRFAVTQNPADRGRFRVPSLRNVALRAPYFHNGGMLTLDDVVDFYIRGGDFHQNQDPLILNIIGAVSPAQRTTLLAFLRTMTDPRVQNEQPPFDRPRLWSEGPNVPWAFGTGTAGSGGLPPRAVAVPPAYIGNPAVTVGVEHCEPNALALVALSFVASQTPVVVLGHNAYLALSPAPVTAAAGLTQGTGPGGGFASLAFTVPNVPSLRGISLFGQWLILDPLGPSGLASSNAFGFPIF